MCRYFNCCPSVHFWKRLFIEISTKSGSLKVNFFAFRLFFNKFSLLLLNKHLQIMEEKIDFAKVPYQYSMCLNRQCPQAGTCLRQLTEQSVPENIEHWIIISPKYLSTVKGGCPHYRSSTKVRYAQGFIGILENLRYPTPNELFRTQNLLSCP